MLSIQDILVVDDDTIVTRMLCRVLSDHKVVVANSGHEAIQRLNQHGFDLILCDLTMPGMSGIEFYELVRAISQDLAQRIVFMTGGAFTNEGHQFLSQFPNSCLEKPFDIGELQRLVESRGSER